MITTYLQGAFFCIYMSFLKRATNRKYSKVRSDVVATSRITREDIFDLVGRAVDKEDAIARVTEFVRALPDGIESLTRYGKEQSIDRIISDLDSYRSFDE